MRPEATPPPFPIEAPSQAPFARQQSFGVLPDGREVERWILGNRHGLVVEVLTYGATMHRLLVPVGNEHTVNVILGYPTLQGYLDDSFYMGATVGRIAGRIGQGRLRVEDFHYQLPCNEGAHHLHGGPGALHARLWQVRSVKVDSAEASLSLALPSPDGDLGYPGAIDISATFSVMDDNAVCFATEVCSDRPTPVSLTQHAYFNLTGENQRDVLQHELEVAAGHYVPAGNNMLPSHEKTSLAGQAPDLRMAKRLCDVVPALWQEHGELYWLGASPELRTVARLWEPQNAILLTVDTTQTCLQTYFGAALADQNGSRWPRFGGLCLECQGYPAASNVDGFGDIIVRPGQPQRHETRFQFSQNPQTLTHSTPQP